jgi:hypothetical protein
LLSLRSPFVFARVAAVAGVTTALLTGCGGQSSLPNAQLGTFAQGGARLVRANSSPPVRAALEWLMTDGTVLVQSGNNGNQWYSYAPDSSGSYADGTWTQDASMPAGYSPDAGASQVLADGRLWYSGGEYNDSRFTLTNLGAIYDPVKNTWTKLGHPPHWDWIGDSPSTMLPNNLVLIGDKLHKWDATYNPKTNKWASVGDAGKSDFNAEEGWTLLADGTILTVDVKNDPNSEIYNPSTQTWKTAGDTPVILASHWNTSGCLSYGPKKKDCYYPPGEIGPAILRPDGSVFATGSGQGTSGTGTGHTAIYYSTGSKAGTWATGPDFPNDDNAGDSFGLLEPSGNVMVFGDNGGVYEFNGKTFTALSSVPSCPPILLPTGQVGLFCSSGIDLYAPTGSPKSSWAPTIKSYPKSIAPGSSYKITGTQFNGLSQAEAFGDEYQTATNYPLVRITNNASGHVVYARTHDHSTMGVATGSKIVSTNFDVPSSIGSGASTLIVVTNGIASKAVDVTVSSARRVRAGLDKRTAP